jgi:enoyl-CoA hydratase/carnithine racemase
MLDFFVRDKRQMSKSSSSAAAAVSDDASAPLLLRADERGVVTLTMNRPARRNALSDELIALLQAALDDIRGDAAVRAVVIAGSGPAFCAGHDLGEVRAKADLAARLDLFRRCAKLMTAITMLPKPVIARVHGAASAAGCQLAAACDLAVAEAGATFATPGVKIGLFCSTPMVALSRKIGRAPAMEMLLTGTPIGASRALSLGLINEVADGEDALIQRAAEIAAHIAANSPQAIHIGKEAFYRQAEMTLKDAYDYTAEVMAQNLAEDDAAEGIAAFLQKRKPVWSA